MVKKLSEMINACKTIKTFIQALLSHASLSGSAKYGLRTSLTIETYSVSVVGCPAIFIDNGNDTIRSVGIILQYIETEWKLTAH